jgi:integrase
MVHCLRGDQAAVTKAIVRVVDSPELPVAVEDELERLRERFWRYAQASTAENTKRVYGRAWRDFVDWCNTKHLNALPAHPETVAWYAVALVAGEAGRKRPLKISSVLTELAAITRAHVESQLAPPTRDPYLRVILRGMRREHGQETDQADPILPRQLRAMVACVLPGLTGTRDLALLTFGWASGLRRSELAALTVSQLRFRDAQCLVTLGRSKGDQEGHGHTRIVHAGAHLDTCPVSALQTWLSAGQIRDGHVFRKVTGERTVGDGLSDRAVDAIVRQYIFRAQQRFPEAIPPGQYSAHSLRSGVATTMCLAGKTDLEIRDHLGHKSMGTTARYVRLAKTLGSSATKDVGL